MENEIVKKEKGKNGLILFLIIIIIGLAAVIAFLLLNQKNDSNNSSNENQSGNNVTNNENNNEEKILKIDSTKDYVYDADYKYNNQKYTEYNRYTADDTITTKTFGGITFGERSGKQLLKDLKVPFININSNDVTKVNKDIEELYLKYAKEFDSCAVQTMTSGCNQVLAYNTFKYNNILSIAIIDSTSSTAPHVFKYHTYVIDLDNGNLLSYNDVLNKLDYDKNKTLENIKNAIKIDLDQEAKKFNVDLSNSSAYCGQETNCYNKAYEFVENDINNNSLLYIVDNNGKLNVYAIPYSQLSQSTSTTKNLYAIDK